MVRRRPDLFDRTGQMLKPRKLGKIQEMKVRKIVSYAYRNVPFYRQRLKEAGVDPKSVRNVDDLQKIPFTVKTDLRDTYPLGILAVPPNRLYALRASSGTTGKPIIVAYTRRDLERWGRLMGRCLDATGVKRGILFRTCSDTASSPAGWAFITGPGQSAQRWYP